MKTIDKRVLDIEKADFGTKFNHDQALRSNVVERILNTPDEKFELVTSDCVLLKINDSIKIKLYDTNGDAEARIYQNGSMVNSFIYREPYISASWLDLKEEEETDHDCEMLQNKIKSIREAKLKITEESKEYMADETKSFYAVFDAISGTAE